MREHQSIKEVMTQSIEIKGGTPVIYPQYKKQSWLDIDMRLVKEQLDDPAYAGFYSYNNGVLCFYYEGRLFVTPHRRDIYAVLRDNGFVERSFYVPFSNGEYPIYDAEKWRTLQRKANEASLVDFKHDCLKWAKKQRIQELPPEILEHCLKIPQSGIELRELFTGEVWTYYPVLNGMCFDAIGVERLGTYCYNNGVTVFVHVDGNTYITRKTIFRELKEARYRKGDLLVPLSNCEQLVDGHLATQWKNCQ